jgi:glucose/arabinose dehydrogenase
MRQALDGQVPASALYRDRDAVKKFPAKCLALFPLRQSLSYDARNAPARLYLRSQMMQRTFSSSAAIFSLAFTLLIAGCAFHSAPTMQSTPTSGVPLSGHVMGGQQPVSGAAIQLYAVSSTADGGASMPLLTGPVSSDSLGRFTITGSYTCPSSSTLVYITASGGNPGIAAGTNNTSLALLTALGACGSLSASTVIMIDERTTVAAVTALAPFIASPSAIGATSVDAAGLSAAFTLASSLVDPATGTVSGPSLPSGASAPAQQINTIANVLAACINSSGGIAGDGSPCGNLFSAATPTSASAPANTVSAMLNIARDPMRNVASLYALTSNSPPFQPQLAGAPTDWTINLSGNAPTAMPLGCTRSLSGADTFTDYTQEQPGICRTLHASDLPAPFVTASATNYSTQVARQNGQLPIVPPGFKVTLYASGLSNARYLLPAANGDIFLAQQNTSPIVVLRGVSANGSAVSVTNFASGLDSPYGMAFYPSAASPQFLYVANTTSLQRFPYTLGDTVASAPPTTLATDLPGGGDHVTRSLVFTNEATPRLLIGVGSFNNYTNTDTDTSEFHRANVLAYSVAGVFQSVFASGTRNPVGLALDSFGKVWISVNERDGLGDNLPADYVTHVTENAFYGWPWYYNGPNPEPRLPNDHPELAAQTVVGDTLLQPHFAPLQIAFYTGQQFPTPYRGDLFVASHGSWNKAVRGGYELLRVRMVNGLATGAYEDFMTGFVNPDGSVWGRPGGVCIGADGAIYVADDLSNSIWRITYIGA